jgi:hypothetical protein
MIWNTPGTCFGTRDKSLTSFRGTHGTRMSVGVVRGSSLCMHTWRSYTHEPACSITFHCSTRVSRMLADPWSVRKSGDT